MPVTTADKLKVETKQITKEQPKFKFKPLEKRLRHLPKPKLTEASKLAQQPLEKRLKCPVNIDDSSEAEAKLKAVADLVDLKKVGVDSTYKPDYLDVDSYKLLKRFVVAQALIDYISQTEAGISLRWFLPDTDFVTSNHEPIKKRDWTFPVNYWYEPTWTVDHEDKRRFIEKEVLLRSHYYSQSMRKVYMFLGVEFPEKPLCTALDFSRSDVKIIEVLSTSQLKPGEIHLMSRPILYKKGDEIKISASIPPDVYGKREKIIFHGIVAEMLGATQAG